MIITPIPSLRVGIKTILNSIPNIEITAEAASLDDSGPLPLPVDVVIFAGLEFPSQTWLAEILQDYPDQAFLFMINSSALSLSNLLLGRRPLGWLSLDSSPGEIAAAIRALQAGLQVIDPLFIALSNGSDLRGNHHEADDSASVSNDLQSTSFEPLTPRETDVLELLAQGLPNKEIARRLIISEHTVKYHISSIYSKFGVNNRTEAVRQGIRSGLIVI